MRAHAYDVPFMRESYVLLGSLNKDHIANSRCYPTRMTRYDVVKNCVLRAHHRQTKPHCSSSEAASNFDRLQEGRTAAQIDQKPEKNERKRCREEKMQGKPFHLLSSISREKQQSKNTRRCRRRWLPPPPSLAPPQPLLLKTRAKLRQSREKRKKYPHLFSTSAETTTST